MDELSALLPSLLDGLGNTMAIFILTLLFSIPLGLPIALGSISKIWPIKGLCKVYVWLFRGTPLMLQLLFIYYGLGIFANNTGLTFLRFDRFPAVIITFTLNYAAYFAEIYRAGIQSIDKGQYEAAKALGFTRNQTMMRIIVPQTIKRIIPPVANETIVLMKDTALAFAISLPDMIKAAKDALDRTQKATGLFIAAVIYLILTFLLTVIYQRLEKRFSRHEQEAI